MTTPCPHCRGTGFTVADPVAPLRAWLLERGFHVGPGDIVDGRAAAAILGIQEQTLRADRAVWGRLPFRRVGARRVVYELAALARFMNG